jgi:hypothetical protein
VYVGFATTIPDGAAGAAAGACAIAVEVVAVTKHAESRNAVLNTLVISSSRDALMGVPYTSLRIPNPKTRT